MLQSFVISLSAYLAIFFGAQLVGRLKRPQ